MRLAIPQLSMLADFGGSKDYGTSPVFPNGASVQPGSIFGAYPTDGGIETTTSVPNWGMAEVMVAVNTSSNTFIPGTLVQPDKNFAIATNSVTDNTGAPIYVCLSNFSAGNTTRQWGWLLASGVCPVKYAVAATTGQVFISAGTAGQATPTANTGGQVNNANCIIAAAGNFTRSITTQNASSFVKVARVNGLYPGIAISGTGIPGSSVISSIDPGGNGFVIGSAVGTPVNATATGTVTGTFTHTGYGIVQINRPFVQGQIT